VHDVEKLLWDLSSVSVLLDDKYMLVVLSNCHDSHSACIFESAVCDGVCGCSPRTSQFGFQLMMQDHKSLWQ